MVNRVFVADLKCECRGGGAVRLKTATAQNHFRQTCLKISLYFSFIKAGFCFWLWFFFFYISVSVQTRYILVLFSQYRCKTKDDSYCCTRSQGRRDGGAEVWAALAFPPPRCWTQPCSPPRRLNRSIPPQRRLISFLTLRGAAPLSPRSSPCQG